MLFTLEEFKNIVFSEVEKCPKNWRKGQSVFNVIDEMFGVARYVQFVDKIDCFYDNDKIDEFIEASWNTYVTAQYDTNSEHSQES